MSVLIKDMEIPARCGDCLFYGLESAGNGMYWDYCRCKRELIDRSDTERGSDCPLVSVPKHGRLIDADALLELIGFEVRHYVVKDEYDKGRRYARHCISSVA